MTRKAKILGSDPRSPVERLKNHEGDLAEHFRKASEFLTKCQIIEPYVEKGTLHGCVCPWEIGESADEGAFPILEDFHDTLEAIWVWSLYCGVANEQIFKTNIDWAWEYIVNNWERFIGEEKARGKSLYDCSYVLLSGTLHATVFNDDGYQSQILKAGNRLERYLSKLESTDEREYRDPFWMTHCLGTAGRLLSQEKWLETAETFVRTTIVNARKPFSKLEEEPKHRGPGGHDFFSRNANKALALMSSLSDERTTTDLLLKFLHCVPERFVLRHADENAWNAHVAKALGKSYVLTSKNEFLSRYFAIMNELARRDLNRSAALPRSPSFSRRESWVTFFYAHAYASVVKDLAYRK